MNLTRLLLVGRFTPSSPSRRRGGKRGCFSSAASLPTRQRAPEVSATAPRRSLCPLLVGGGGRDCSSYRRLVPSTMTVGSSSPDLTVCDCSIKTVVILAGAHAQLALLLAHGEVRRAPRVAKGVKQQVAGLVSTTDPTRRRFPSMDLRMRSTRRMLPSSPASRCS